MELWRRFQTLKSSPGGAKQVLGQVDPAVFVLRRRILTDSLKGLWNRSPLIRLLSMEQKKILAGRLSNVVWKGYLLALAYQELVCPSPTMVPLVDAAYLSGVFRRLADRHKDPQESLARLDGRVVRSLTELQTIEVNRLEDLLAEAGAGAVVKDEAALLRAAIGGLALMGFLIWVAQRKALGHVDGID